MRPSATLEGSRVLNGTIRACVPRGGELPCVLIQPDKRQSFHRDGSFCFSRGYTKAVGN